MNDFSQMANMKLAHIDDALKETTRMTETLEKVSVKLRKVTLEISHHCQSKNISNEEINHVLWHDLHNVQHQLLQFTKYTEDSLHDFTKEALELADTLSQLRPKKPQA